MALPTGVDRQSLDLHLGHERHRVDQFERPDHVLSSGFVLEEMRILDMCFIGVPVGIDLENGEVRWTVLLRNRVQGEHSGFKPHRRTDFVPQGRPVRFKM